MDRATKRFYAIVLASCLSFPLFAQDFIQHDLGNWTQIQGDSSFLLYKSGVKKPTQVKTNDKIKTEGSYLSNDDGYMTGKLFNNCWVRLGPRTKIVFSFAPNTKILYLKVFTGSVKVLFNRDWTEGKVEKLILESAEKQLETESGKFVFIRRPFFNESGLFVEKGVITVVHENRLQSQFLHQHEKISFNDKTMMSSEIGKMNEKEIKELSSSQYLKLLGQTGL